MSEKNNSIETFVKRSLEQIKKGIGDDHYLDKPIDFELSTVTTEGKRGSIDIKVVQLGKDVENNAVQKIRFSVDSKDNLEFKEKEAVKGFLDKTPQIALRRYMEKR